MLYQNEQIVVIGAGSWGTALSILVAENFWRVKLWGRNPVSIRQISRRRCNSRYLPGITLPDNVVPVVDFDDAVKDSVVILIVSPGYCFTDILTRLRQSMDSGASLSSAKVILWGTKGLGDEGVLLSDIARQILDVDIPLGVVSGPSFAMEVAQKMPTALTVACTDKNLTPRIATWFHSTTTRIYHSRDLIGVQLGGAIKNIIAIAAGLSDGLGYGANARAALITRGLSELTRLGVAMGGKQETFMGLSGLGDLILTCTDNQSRNRRLGLGIGKGQSRQQVMQEIKQSVEGVTTAKLLFELAKKHQIDMPISEQVYRIICLDQDPKESVRALLQRNTGIE